MLLRVFMRTRLKTTERVDEGYKHTDRGFTTRVNRKQRPCVRQYAYVTYCFIHIGSYVDCLLPAVQETRGAFEAPGFHGVHGFCTNPSVYAHCQLPRADRVSFVVRVYNACRCRYYTVCCVGCINTYSMRVRLCF